MLKDILGKVVANGFECVPIKPGTKRPDVFGWQGMALGDSVYSSWVKGKPNHGVGLRLGGSLYAIDIDILDASCVQKICDELEFEFGIYEFRRTGLAPKTAFLFRCAPGLRKKKVLICDEVGAKHAIEILGDGQQIVAYGIHPDTGSEFAWEGAQPLNTNIDLVPELSEPEVMRFIESVASVLPAGWVVTAINDAGNTADEDCEGEDDDDFLLNAPLSLSIEEVRDDLEIVTAESLDYDQWFRFICAINHQTQGSDEGFELARWWSEKDAARFDLKTLKAKWREAGKPSGSGKKVTCATIREIAQRIRKKDVVQSSVIALSGWEEKIANAGDTNVLRVDVANGIAADKSIDGVERARLVALWQKRYKDLDGIHIPLKDVKDALTKKRVPTSHATDAPDFMLEHCWVSSRDKFLNVRTQEWLTMLSFNSRYSHEFPDENGLIAPSAASHKAFHTFKIKNVSNALYVPFLDPFFELDGREVVNTFRRESIPCGEDMGDAGVRAVEVVKNHLSHLFDGRSDQVALFIDWLAFQVQHTGRKVRFAPIFKGIEGDGKSMLASLIKSVLGRENVKVISAEAVTSTFNGWATDAALGVLEEVRIAGHSRYEVLNKVKPLVTNDEISIHAKGIEEYNTLNTMNYLALTNYADALPLSDTDRRWWVIFTPWQSLAELELRIGCDAGDYFQDLARVISDYSGALRHWLETHVISDQFNPNGRAPETREKRVMMASSRDSDDDFVEAFIDDCVREGVTGVTDQVISISHLKEAIVFADGSRDLSEIVLSRILKKLGYTKSVESRIRWNGGRIRPYVKNPTADADTIRSVLDGSANNIGDDEDIPF